MEYKDCLQQIQKYLENNPLIILGSGSSATYGIPLMDKLSDEIKKHGDKFDDKDKFTSLCNNLASMNLEEAIDKTVLSDASSNTLREIVWQCINRHDLAFLKKLLQDRTNYALADLLKIVILPTPNIATVVTTNYDRLAEYAADMIGATTVTGFEGSLIREMAFPTYTMQQQSIRARERVVFIWKVHGSLDWFEKNNEIVSLPLSAEIPSNHRPLIIAPGKGKYNLIYIEPYRDIITHTDNAFSKAGSFLCIGYGFNDDHIQPKLIKQIKSGKPIVVLCRKATDACKQNVVSTDVKKFMLIEHYMNGKTSVMGNGFSKVYDGDFWQLPDFIKTIWR